jgi:hypothetical protein
MGRFDRRNSLKMKRRVAQAKKKGRQSQCADLVRAERKAKRGASSKAPKESSKEKPH